MSNLDICFLDNSNSTKEEVNTIKPSTYQELIKQIKQKFKNLPENFTMFILDENNKEKIIRNDDDYRRILINYS